jgi:5'-3' exonuclease
MQTTIQGLKQNYLNQLKQQSDKIANLTRELDAAKITVEQLRGAVFALDQIATESAAAKQSAAAEQAATQAQPAEAEEQKEG